jgi:transposase InsO family protein
MQFAAERPNQVWLADITYVPTKEGWLYLAVVLDLFTRKIVGWAMRGHMRAECRVRPRQELASKSPCEGESYIVRVLRDVQGMNPALSASRVSPARCSIASRIMSISWG